MSDTFASDYRNALNDLAFSSSQKDALAKVVAARTAASGEMLAAASPNAQAAPASSASPAAPRRARRTAPRRRLHTVLAAAAVAAVLVAGGGAAYATTGLTLAKALDDLFAGGPVPTELAGTVGVPVGASATDSGITITADAIVGDTDNLACVFSISNADGTPLDLGEPNENGLLPAMFSRMDIDIDGASGSYGGYHFYDSDEGDGSVQLVDSAAYQLFAGDSLIGRTARVEMHDLMIFGDDPENPRVIEGTWKMKFTVNYADASQEMPVPQGVQVNGQPVTVERLLVSPVGVSVTYSFDEPVSVEAEGSARLLDLGGVELVLDDGSVIEVEDNGGGSVTRAPEGQAGTTCQKGIMLDRVIDAERVAQVRILGSAWQEPQETWHEGGSAE